MATIITKNSTTPGNIPGTIVQGELAINTADGKLFYGSGSVAKEFTASSALSSSYAVTASYVTGSIFNSTNPALSASYALTASYAFNSVPGDGNTTIQFNDAGAFSGSGNFTFTKISNIVNLTGSLKVTGSIITTGSILVTQSFISKVDYIEFISASDQPTAVGRLGWNDSDGTLSLGLKGGNLDLLIGEAEVAYVFNAEATTLTKGTVVYISGSQGNRIAVKRASNSAEGGSAGTLGFVAEPITSGGTGFIITSGVLKKVDTSAYTAGQLVYLSSSAGQFTPIKPIAPQHEVRLGYIERVDNIVGSIYVKVDNGYELDELHNVLDTTTTSSFGDLLVKSGSLWITSKQLTGSYGLTGSLQATSFTGSLQGTSSWAVSASQAITASYVAPAGSNFQIQYNNNGTLGATGSFRFNYLSQSLEQGDNVLASGLYSHAEGNLSTASGWWSHAEGFSKATAFWSHAEGLSVASGIYAHSEGNNTQASGQGAHSEGDATLASGLGSHAEGQGTIALNTGAHSEGRLTSASGFFSHAEGENTKATGQSSHAEGRGTETISNFSHAEGSGSITRGIASHAEGWGTITSGSFQHVQGQFNLSSSAQSAFIIGNGTSDSARSNLVFASGSDFQITGSLRVTGSAFVVGLTNTSQTNVLTYNSTTGQVFFTASSAIGSSGGVSGTGADTLVAYWSGSTAVTGSAGFFFNNTTNTLTVPSFIESSAQRFKTNILPLTNSLENVQKLKGVSFNRIDGNNRKELGLIADEVEKIYPELVSYDNDGQIHGLQYPRITALLIESIKELSQQVHNQQIFINELKNRIEKLENNGTTTIN